MIARVEHAEPASPTASPTATPTATPTAIETINSPASFLRQFSSPRKLSSHVVGNERGFFDTLTRLLQKPPPAPPATVVDVHSVATVAAVGALLNFNAAYINATVWLLHGHATTHVTGLTTKTAMALSAEQMTVLATGALQLLCFLLGANS